MKSLKSLVFSAIPQADADPRLARRAKLIRKLEEQKALALDPTLTRTVVKRVPSEDGNKRQVIETRPVRPWWKENLNGGLFLTVRFGTRPIEFEKGKAAILIASHNDLISTLDKLIEAVRAGEFDDLLVQNSKAPIQPKSKRAAA